MLAYTISNGDVVPALLSRPAKTTTRTNQIFNSPASCIALQADAHYQLLWTQAQTFTHTHEEERQDTLLGIRISGMGLII